MIKVIQGDITEINVDAIVNAANTSLLGGGGVDGAIHKAGGIAILNECIAIRDKQGGCSVGEAVITTAGDLPARFVIHTVGPVWRGGMKNEATLLANAYRNSLMMAEENGVETIAFPNISTGVYGFPRERAAVIAVTTVKEFLKSEHKIKEVIFVCYDPDNYNIYSKLLRNGI